MERSRMNAIILFISQSSCTETCRDPNKSITQGQLSVNKKQFCCIFLCVPRNFSLLPLYICENMGYNISTIAKEVDTMTDQNTQKFIVPSDDKDNMRRTLRAVFDALKEKGYNPVNQIVGYLLTEDPTYITNYNNARSMICKLDRDELLQELVRCYLA